MNTQPLEAELITEITKLRLALKPFADFADNLAEGCPDNIALGIYVGGGIQFGPNGGVSVANLRIARNVLKDMI